MISIDTERAKIAFPMIIDMYQQRTVSWIYPEQLPQNNLIPTGVERGSKDHALFLFFTVPMMTFGVHSQAAFAASIELYRMERLLFSPLEAALSYQEEDIRKILSRTGTLNFKSRIIAKAWKENAKALMDYNWNPINIFNGLEAIEEVWNLLPNLLIGYGKKVSSLLVAWFEELNLTKEFFGPPPLDFHVLRVLIAAEILTLEKAVRREKIERAIGPILAKICREKRFSTTPLDAGMWLLSKHLCKYRPRRCQYCPLAIFCEWHIDYADYRKARVMAHPNSQLLMTFGKHS